MKQQEDFQELNILCIGENSIGKSHFLTEFTCDASSQNIYRIYIKQIHHVAVYFHELAEEEELYLETEYDGIIFFLDFKYNWKVQENILKWLQLYSKNSGCNIFKVPIHTVVLNYNRQSKFQKWRKSIEKQLVTIIEASQISFCSSHNIEDDFLNEYIAKLMQKQGEGIKFTHYTYWKLYGLSEYLRHFVNYMQLFFFRSSELYEKLRGKKTKNDQPPI